MSDVCLEEVCCGRKHLHAMTENLQKGRDRASYGSIYPTLSRRYSAVTARIFPFSRIVLYRHCPTFLDN